MATAAAAAATATATAPRRTKPGFTLAGVEETSKPLAHFTATLRATDLIPILNRRKLAKKMTALIAFEIVGRHDVISLPW